MLELQNISFVVPTDDGREKAILKDINVKIDERFASHHKMGYHCLSHKHEKCLTSFIIGEMQNRTAVCMIFLEKSK